MAKELFVMFIERGATYNRMTKAVVTRHVDNIRRLDENGQLELCGLFKGYPGVAGMLILRADSLKEADALCKQEPLVVEGFATYRLYAFKAANSDNNYLL